ncbi:MAG TPA: homoserine dehydrogenase, partial [Halieaceae bacterium]|nr:homoserine dehydrogenase [Halieaceae bacterium]
AGQATVPLIVLTNRAAQGRVDAAVAEIEALDTITGQVVRIRVEPLDG